jgi:outer membrane protein assembly factor BamB
MSKRISVTFRGLIGILILSAIVLAACGAGSGTAVMYRGDAQRTGFFETDGVPVLNGVKWKFQTDDEVWSSPVIADGVVYFGSDDDHLYAVNAETGESVWHFETGDDIHSSPAVSDGLVYIFSYDGYLYAVDVEKGQEVWKFDTLDDSLLSEIHRPSYDDYMSSPVVDKSVVYIGGLDPRKCLFALDAKTGSEIWHFEPESVDQVRSSPAIFGDMIFFGSEFSKFYALDINTGELKWDKALGGNAGYAPAVDKDGIVYFSSKDTFLYAVDGQTGEEKWRNNLASSSWVTSSPAIANGLVYAGTSDGRQLHAVNQETGEIQWAFPAKGYVWSSPAVGGEIFYVGSGNGAIYAVDALTGQEIWNFKTEGSVYSTPVVADGVVYVGSLDGYLYALE